MSHRASVAALLLDLDGQSPAGFAIALHVRFATPTYMFQTYARRWMDHYSATGMVLRDPVAHWGLQNIGRITWADLEAHYGGGVMDAAKDFGLMNGVAIAVVHSGSRSIAGFARADRDFTEAETDDLEEGLVRLHNATFGPGRLSKNDAAALIELSIQLTR